MKLKGRDMEGSDVSYDFIPLEDWSREMCMAEIERLEVEIPLLSEELKQQTAHPRETTLTQLDRLMYVIQCHVCNSASCF